MVETVSSEGSSIPPAVRFTAISNYLYGIAVLNSVFIGIVVTLLECNAVIHIHSNSNYFSAGKEEEGTARTKI